MTVLSDKIVAADTSVDAAVVRIQAQVQAFRDEIARLQKLVDEGTATPEDLQKLDDMKAKVDAIDPTSPVTLKR